MKPLMSILPRSANRRAVFYVLCSAGLLLALGLWLASRSIWQNTQGGVATQPSPSQSSPSQPSPSSAASVRAPAADAREDGEAANAQWTYGRQDARFTAILYADLECPFCRAYFPDLKRFIGANPDVSLQWHHLPLAIHDPAATDEARLAQCAGLAAGDDGFWSAVTWIYANTRANGQGLPRNARYPGMNAAMQQCLDSDRPDAALRLQQDQAGRDNIAATPTLRLLDRNSGKTLLINGPAEDSELLSAIDMLIATARPGSDNSPMSTDAVGDMPR